MRIKQEQNKMDTTTTLPFIFLSLAESGYLGEKFEI